MCSVSLLSEIPFDELSQWTADRKLDQFSIAMAMFVEKAVASVVPPAEPGKLLEKGEMTADVLLAYYAAYGKYVELCQDLGSSVGSCSAVSEPSTEPSVGSSASSGRAKKRARWRQRVRENKRRASQSTLSVSSGEPVVSPARVAPDPAVCYCYRQMFHPGCGLDSATVTFGELLGVGFDSLLPAEQLAELTVVRESTHLYHVGFRGGGYPLLACLAAVAASVERSVHKHGSLGAYLYDDGLVLPMPVRRKSPSLTDSVGMKVVLRDDEDIQLYDCTAGIGSVVYTPENGSLRVQLGVGESAVLTASQPFLVPSLTGFETIGPHCNTTNTLVVHGPANLYADLLFLSPDLPVRVVLMAASDAFSAYCGLAESLAAAGRLLGAVEYCDQSRVRWGTVRYNEDLTRTSFINPEWLGELLLPVHVNSHSVTRRASAYALAVLGRLGRIDPLQRGIRTTVPLVHSRFEILDCRSNFFPRVYEGTVVVLDDEDAHRIRKFVGGIPVLTVSQTQGRTLDQVSVISPKACATLPGCNTSGKSFSLQQLWVAFTRGACVQYWTVCSEGDLVEVACAGVARDRESLNSLVI